MDAPVCFFLLVYEEYISYMYMVCLFSVFVFQISFFSSPGILIDRLINITAALSCGLGGLQLSIQMLRMINYFFSLQITGEGKKKHHNPRWAMRQGNSTYTKCSAVALELHRTCFWKLNLSFRDFVHQRIQLQAWIIVFPSEQLTEIT